jgi:hypothetical protein
MPVVFVTAFHPVRSGIEPYLIQFEKLVRTGISIILFLDPRCTLPAEYPNVRVIPAELDTKWAREDTILPENRLPEKDTALYMCTMLSKLHCMEEATKYTDCEMLAWIDFGVFHIVKYPEVTSMKLRAIASRTFPTVKKILSPGCWPTPGNYEIWKTICWRYCGGFFLGPRGIFAAANKRQAELVEQGLPRLVWEVNYWTRMEEFFEWYPADHNDSMIMSMPYSPAVHRLSADPVRYIGDTRYKKIAVGGPIEQFVYETISKANLSAVFPKTDMLVGQSEYTRMKPSQTWDDPAIANGEAILNQMELSRIRGTIPLLFVECSRAISDKRIVHLPADDETFVHGLVLDHPLPNWELRRPVAIWRGASSAPEQPSLRSRVVHELIGYPHADAKFVRGGWPQNDAVIPPEHFGDRIDIGDHLKYKYMISIDGNGTASSIQWIFGTGCVPILVFNPKLDFWMKRYLVHGVNCMIVHRDVRSTIQWLVEHDDDARKIATNALEFGRTVLSSRFQREHLQKEIERAMFDAIPGISWKEYFGPPGLEHYRLLERLAQSFEGRVIVDIRTHMGASALALSKSKNTIHSFDIQHSGPLMELPNVSYHLDDVMTPEGREKWKSELLGSAFIMLDIDPHEGSKEYEFYCWLRDNDYRGFMICDDIWYFKGMRDNFWYKIPSEHKIDVTEEGHFSGTGIVRFHPSELWPARQVPSNWTVVTGYFDLTKMEDASPSIRGRPASHYLVNASTTMALDQNLMVFCEPENVEALRALRPEHLRNKTVFVPMSFEDFPLTHFRQRILDNRKKLPDFDDRNTASYYLLCMARYAMLKMAIASNPFGSTHFAWLNICIERMGFKNCMNLDAVFRENRDKFSTCHIDYQPRSRLDESVRMGLCSMCSGFFTGNAHYMGQFCDRIEKKFLEYLDRGIGHADEQLFNAVFYDDRSIFDTYCGDYTEMVTNYVHVKERPEKPLNLVIEHSFVDRDFDVCLHACRRLWNSFTKGYASLSDEDAVRLLRYYRACLKELGLPPSLN